MATVRVRGNFARTHDRLRRLQDRVQHPLTLTTRLARLLVSYLGENVPIESGTLLRGLLKVQVQERHASIGDGSVLTDWSIKPPRGTIAEFIRWLREENARRRGTRGERAATQRKAKTTRTRQYRARARGWEKARITRARGQKIRGGKLLSRFYRGLAEKLFGWEKFTEKTWSTFSRGLARRRVYLKSSKRFVRLTYRRQKALAYLRLRELRFGSRPITAERYAQMRYDLMEEFKPAKESATGHRLRLRSEK